MESILVGAEILHIYDIDRKYLSRLVGKNHFFHVLYELNYKSLFFYTNKINQ